jgi:ferritin-like metal-binding protein YciE
MERQILKALPMMIKATQDPDLKEGLPLIGKKRRADRAPATGV